MPVLTKRQKAAEAVYERVREYPLEEAIQIVKRLPVAKFDEAVDLSIRLGVDPKHADQMVRGAIVLPHGIGKAVTRSGRPGRPVPTTWAPRTWWSGSRAGGWSSTRPSPRRT
jgi:hypothetical protein